MAPEFSNPAIAALVAAIGTELVFGQVLIRRVGAGFELRHAADVASDPAGLRLLAANEIRPWAQFTASGAFRPLRSAPHLRAGWRFAARDTAALASALNELYPGVVADWFAAQAPQPPVTSYRDFTARQTGMYRIATMLNDAVAGAMIRACCDRDFCLKRRLWSVAGLPGDDAVNKSLIPCLEPCAILLEFARKVARLEQQEAAQSPQPPPPGDVESLAGECDFDSPENPRRRRFVLEKARLPVTPAQT